MRICRTWRNIVLSTPQLWAGLCIRQGYKLKDSKAIDDWIARAGALPLSLELTHVNDCDGATVERLLRYFTRWKAIHVYSSFLCQCTIDILQRMKTPTRQSHLTDFRVICYHNEEYHAAPRISAHLPSTFQFTELYFGGNIYMEPILDGDPFTSMRELRIGSVPGAPSCFQIIHQCPSLEVLEIACPSLRRPDTQQTTTRTLLKLHTFILSSDCITGLYLLNHLHFPALQRLSITFPWLPVEIGRDWSTPPNDWSTPPQLFLKQGVNLQALHLRLTFTSLPALIGILTTVPNLRTLSLGAGKMIMRGVFNAMRPGNTPLNPFLEEVECLGPHWSEVARSVAPMVLSRCNHSTEHSDGALASAISRPHTVKFEDQRIVDEFLGLPGIASCVQKGLAVLRTNEVRSWWCNKVPPPRLPVL